jgi:flagellar protein FlbT
MALKLTLKPGERAIVGGAVIRNDQGRQMSLLIENEVPVLRHKQILSASAADTPAARLYFATQLMYIDATKRQQMYPVFVDLLRDFVENAPSTRPLLQRISEAVVQGEFYSALRMAWQLIERERNLISNAELCAGRV